MYLADNNEKNLAVGPTARQGYRLTRNDPRYRGACEGKTAAVPLKLRTAYRCSRVDLFSFFASSRSRFTPAGAGKCRDIGLALAG